MRLQKRQFQHGTVEYIEDWEDKGRTSRMHHVTCWVCNIMQMALAIWATGLFPHKAQMELELYISSFCMLFNCLTFLCNITDSEWYYHQMLASVYILCDKQTASQCIPKKSVMVINSQFSLCVPNNTHDYHSGAKGFSYLFLSTTL